MALGTDSTTNERPTTLLGEALEQMGDHRMADRTVADLQFCERSQNLVIADSPRPEPEVIWAD